MNFEKLILKNKRNIWIVLAVVLVIFFISIPNKVLFLYKTPLGRAYLIALLIIITTFNRYLGLLSVLLIVSIYNSTDTLIENMENSDSDKETKEDSSIVSAIGAQFGLEPKKDESKTEDSKNDESKTEDSKKDKPITIGEKTDRESFMNKPKSSSSLISTLIPSDVKREPRANWDGKAGYNLGYAPLNY
jgi:hypothetical protein